MKLAFYISYFTFLLLPRGCATNHSRDVPQKSNKKRAPQSLPDRTGRAYTPIGGWFPD